MERARSVVADFAPGSAELAVIREICERLDGIPLAIELAAARLRSMTAIQLRDRLGERFRLLTGGSRRAQERHQTLRQAVQWSYDLLAEPEKRVLSRATAFAGGFSLEGAEAVCAGDGVDHFEVLDHLDSLVRKSLVVVDRSGDAARFSLLETIRQFGEERLGEQGQAAATREAHARFFAATAVATYQRWESPDRLAAGDWFERELGNLRTAFQWSLEAGELELAGDLVRSSLMPAWERMRFEVVAWAIEAIEPARAAGARCLADLLALASRCFIDDRLVEARAFAEEAIGLYADVESQTCAPYAWNALAALAVYEQHFDDCIAYSAAGSALPEDAKLLLCRIWWVGQLAISGRTEEAKEAADRGFEIAMATRIPYALGSAFWAYGGLYWFSSLDPVAAMAALERSRGLFHAGGCRYSEQMAARDFASVHAVYGEPRVALTAFSAVLGELNLAGHSRSLGYALSLLCVLLGRLERHEALAVLQGPTGEHIRAVPQLATRFDEAVAEARAALGENRFRDASDRGGSMTPRQAASYAREQVRQLLEELAEGGQ